jgi:pyrroloquinoline quinone (PQQ) biosynthesis protein C
MDVNMSNLDAFYAKLVEMANAQFESEEYKLLLGQKLTRGRAQIYAIQRSYYVLNRRNCWGYVQAKAPFDVKKLVWDHEREELGGDPSRGLDDHFTLGVKEGKALGLTADDFQNLPPLPTCAACCRAWEHLAMTSPWLMAIAASSALEMSNSDEVIKGGSMSRRMAEKRRDELGIPIKEQHSDAEHMVADVEHGHLMMTVARKYALTKDAQEQMIEGAAESLKLERVFKGAIALAYEKCKD